MGQGDDEESIPRGMRSFGSSTGFVQRPGACGPARTASCSHALLGASSPACTGTCRGGAHVARPMAIHINGVPSRNAWYQGLTEQTMREHMAQESRGALPPDPLKDTWELVDRCVPGATYQASGLTCTLASCTPVTFPRGGTPAGLQPGRTYYRWTSNCRPNDPAPVAAPARRVAPLPVIRR